MTMMKFSVIRLMGQKELVKFLGTASFNLKKSIKVTKVLDISVASKLRIDLGHVLIFTLSIYNLTSTSNSIIIPTELVDHYHEIRPELKID